MLLVLSLCVLACKGRPDEWAFSGIILVLYEIKVVKATMW